MNPFLEQEVSRRQALLNEACVNHLETQWLLERWRDFWQRTPHLEISLRWKRAVRPDECRC
jgi:hypothetical protein